VKTDECVGLTGYGFLLLPHLRIGISLTVRSLSGPPGIPVLKVQISPPLATKFPKIPVIEKRSR